MYVTAALTPRILLRQGMVAGDVIHSVLIEGIFLTTLCPPRGTTIC